MQLPSTPTTDLNNASGTYLKVRDVQAHAVAGNGYIIAQGAYTTHLQNTENGHIDTKNTTEYSRIEDGPQEKAQFLRVDTTTVDTRSARIIGADELPAFALGLKNAVNSVVLCDVPARTPAATSGRSVSPDGLAFSSLPSTPAARTAPGGRAAPGSFGSSNDADNEASSPDSSASSSTGVISVHPAVYGPITEEDHRRHEWFRQVFNRYKARLAATESEGNEASPTPSLASLANPLSSSPLLPLRDSATPKAINVPAPHFNGLQGPLSPLTPLTSSAAPSRKPTPSSDVDIGELFTPNTLRVWDDMDLGIEHGCSSPYRGPSTPGASQPTQPIRAHAARGSVAFSGLSASSGTSAGRAAARLATPKRLATVILTDSEDEEGGPATPTRSSAKKRRV